MSKTVFPKIVHDVRRRVRMKSELQSENFHLTDYNAAVFPKQSLLVDVYLHAKQGQYEIAYKETEKR